MPDDAHWIHRATRSARRRVPHRGPLTSVSLLPPHASLRRYARAQFAAQSEIVMLMPPRGATPDEAGGAERGPLHADPFVVTQRWLDGLGLPVPQLYDIDSEHDALWLEDLGGVDLDRYVSEAPEQLVGTYERTLDLLLSFQRQTAATEAPTLVTDRHFDRDILRWELDHYLEWRVEAFLGKTVSPTQREALDLELDRLVDALAAMPITTMHRDFQSHNLMVREDGEIVMLDFQDAMKGPAVYDAVALLRDSYVVLPPDVLNHLIGYYAAGAAKVFPALSADEIALFFHLQTVQRKLKDAGRFVYIDRVKNNDSFLKYIDDSVRYVQQAFVSLGDDWASLAQVIADIDPEAAP